MRNKATQLFTTALGAALMATALLAVVPAPAHAKIVCWTDDNGNRACGDRVPPKYANKERQILDENARVREVQAAKKDEAQARAEREAAQRDAERQRQLDEQRRYDRYLVQTFNSVDQLQAARNERLAMIDGRIRLAEKAVADNQAALLELERQAQPHRDKNKELPEKLSKQIKDFQASMVDNEQSVKSLQAERVNLLNQFDRDIKRYQALTGSN